MAFKFVILSCFVALARGGVLVAQPAVAAPVAQAVVSARLEEFDSYPQYNFGYNVADSLTGDYKSQTEQRNGDLVQGQYRVADPDGTIRTVDYTADNVNGFNAVVRKEPVIAAAPAVVAEPAVVPARIAAAPVPAAPIAAAPVYPARYTAPIYAAAPVAKFAAYTAPRFVTNYAYPAPAPVVAV